MPDRTALLICCSQLEASVIREQAKSERRTLSNYVLNIAVRAAQMEELLSESLGRRLALVRPPARAHPRTAVLIRCSQKEAEKIREAARRREASISAFVLHCLERTWWVKNIEPGVSHHHAAPPAWPN